MQSTRTDAHLKYAHNAATTPRVVHSVSELRMALEEKARGQRIAQLRKRKHLTQQAMAERLGIAYRTYQTWEAGQMPEWPNVEKLAAFFDVKPEQIIGEVDVTDEDTVSQLDEILEKLDEILDRLEAMEPPQKRAAQAAQAAARKSRQRKPESQADKDARKKANRG